MLSCGHMCGGIYNESPCLPCLHGCNSDNSSLKQDADDMCMICFIEALSCAPAIQVSIIIYNYLWEIQLRNREIISKIAYFQCIILLITYKIFYEILSRNSWKLTRTSNEVLDGTVLQNMLRTIIKYLWIFL